MKKITIILFSLILCLALAACGNKTTSNNDSNGQSEFTSEATSNSGYFKLDVLDETVIEGYTDEGLKQTELVIPADCTAISGLRDNETVEQIIFKNPDTVIEPSTFSGCTNLKHIKLPDNMKDIGRNMFNNCQSLKDVSLPDGVVSIAHDAFNNCTSLETIEFGNNLVAIDRDAFWNCSSLKSLSLPDPVETIGENAFKNCESLEEVSFGTGLKTIGEEAFDACKNLKSVKLQEGVKSIENYAFFTAGLEEIYLPASIESISIQSIPQNITVYVVEGSYADQTLNGWVSDMGVRYNIQYQ